MTTIASETNLITKSDFDRRSPADDTKKFMQDINSTIKIMQKDIDSISKQLDRNLQDHEKIMRCLDDFIDKADGRYLSKDQYTNDIKPIKSVVFGMVGFVLLAFLAAVVAIVIKQ